MEFKGPATHFSKGRAQLAIPAFFALKASPVLVFAM